MVLRCAMAASLLAVQMTYVVAERATNWWTTPNAESFLQEYRQKTNRSPSAASETPMEAFFQNQTFQSMAGDFHFLYHMPPNLKKGEKPKGLFLMLHGCQRGAAGFFRLPEEGAMAAAVLLRGYAVAAPDSPPRPGSCWNVDEDAHRLVLALPEAQTQLGLQNSPLYGIGVSTGGNMLASLVSTFFVQFNGVNFNVSPNSTELFLQATSPWPRTSFVSDQDDVWAKPDIVEESAAFLERIGTPVQKFENSPHPLDDLPGLSPVLNVDRAALVQATKVISKAGLAVKKLGHTFLVPNAADAAFEKVIEAPGFQATLKGKGRALREELAVMDSAHGPTAEHIEKVLDFLLQQGAGQGV